MILGAMMLLTRTSNVSYFTIHCSFGRNIIEAASNGAINSIKLIAYVVANLISFVALIAFLNATLGFLGGQHPTTQLRGKYTCKNLNFTSRKEFSSWDRFIVKNES